MATRDAVRVRPTGGPSDVAQRVRDALIADDSLGWRGFGSQILILTPPALLYFLVRDLASGQEHEAFANASSIVDLQKSLGLDWEATFQQRILDLDWLIAFVNWIYIYGHFPLLIVALILLFGLSRPQFRTLRNALIASGAIGLVCFALYPVAPPRLFAPDEFFDSLGELSRSYRILQNPSLTNQFAAVPSFHVGWNLLVAVAVWRSTRSRVLRTAAVVFPCLMIVAVLLTANHWILDIVAGAAVAAFGVGAAALFDRWVVPRMRRQPAAEAACESADAGCCDGPCGGDVDTDLATSV
ncbi:MAG: phosphatase PAP2 family protein [Actinomycetota bacterium]